MAANNNDVTVKETIKHGSKTHAQAAAEAAPAAREIQHTSVIGASITSARPPVPTYLSRCRLKTSAERKKNRR